MVTRINPAVGMPPVTPPPVEDTDVNPTGNVIVAPSVSPNAVPVPTVPVLPTLPAWAAAPEPQVTAPVRPLVTQPQWFGLGTAGRIISAAAGVANSYPPVPTPATPVATPVRPTPTAAQTASVNQASKAMLATLQRIMAWWKPQTASGVIGSVATPTAPNGLYDQFIQGFLRP